jgi:pimeloyl-ACP methyl ester carboxylesterase
MKKLLRLLASALAGYAVFQQVWVFLQLRQADARRTLAIEQNRAARGIRAAEITATPAYTIRRVIENGIERVSYLPAVRRFETPLLMQHGMFHDAWCWHLWQARLAELGWESHAHSLPGHGASPVQRPIPLCTIDYYLSFFRDEVERLGNPILLGHSLGGAIVQWYLKYVRDDPPAVVLLAPWVADSVLRDGFAGIIRQDPAVFPLTMLTWDARSWVRTPRRAAQKFLGNGAAVTPEEFHTHLSAESALITYQHNPPFWSPPREVRARMLVLAAEADAVVTARGLRRTARVYNADFAQVERAPHTLMLAANWQASAELVGRWLERVKR